MLRGSCRAEDAEILFVRRHSKHCVEDGIQRSAYVDFFSVGAFVFGLWGAFCVFEMEGACLLCGGG